MSANREHVMWHDLECGRYLEDLPLWRSLAAEHGDPVLDIGAGTGRVALDLARRGYRVTALDRDEVLLGELACRARGMDLITALGDARSFDLGLRFPLCIVPMQTIQLLGGAQGREAFLCCARRHLHEAGLLAIAIAEQLDTYEPIAGAPGPIPDVGELEGAVYSSQPTAVRANPEGFVLERRRELITTAGRRTAEQDVIRLDRLTAERLVREARAAGLRPAGRASVTANEEYSGSEVVLLRV